jgi:heme-degrading monooxygenase HmoA
VYRWRVKPGEESQFIQAWAIGTRLIRAQVKGAEGSLLLRQRDDPTTFMAIAQWESFEDWQAFSPEDTPAPEAFRRVANISTLDTVQVFEPVQDLVIDED